MARQKPQQALNKTKRTQEKSSSPPGSDDDSDASSLSAPQDDENKVTVNFDDKMESAENVEGLDDEEKKVRRA